MKKLILLLAILSCSALLKAQTLDPKTLPQDVQLSFTKAYPNATNIVWDKHGKKFDVSFNTDSVSHTATFKDTGMQTFHQYPVSVTSLPKEVRDGVEREFSTTNIASADKIEDEGKIQYQLSLPSGDAFVKVVMSDKGALIKNLSEDQ